VEKEVEHLRKSYDDLKLKSTRQRLELENLRDSVKDLELDRVHADDSVSRKQA
jgi:hypothetical protein